MPRKTLRESKLSSLRKRTDIRKRTGYAIHVTENPREAYLSPRVQATELGNFQDPWDAFCKLTGCETLAQAIEKEFFSPSEVYHQWELEAYPQFFAEVFSMRIRDLENLRNLYTEREAPLYLKDRTCVGVMDGLVKRHGICIANFGQGYAIPFTWGLPVFLGQTLWDGVCQALQANPQALQLLAFPVKQGSEIHSAPLGVLLARPDYLASDPAYAIQVDCLP